MTPLSIRVTAAFGSVVISLAIFQSVAMLAAVRPAAADADLVAVQAPPAGDIDAGLPR